MKKILSVLLTCVMILTILPTVAFADTGNVVINETNFPDANFRTYVKTFDKNSDGTLSASEIAAVTEISCSNKNIGSLKGIEYFTNVNKLDCRNNSLTSLDVSKNTGLIQFWCSGNKLTSLDVSQNDKLWDFACDNNSLTAIDVSNNADLGSLNVSDNKLTTISVNKNYNLNFLDIENNNLTSLNLSNNTYLEGLNSDGNTYDIIPDSNGQFKLSNLPGGFNVSKTSSWSGGSVSGNVLTVDKDADKVTYNYYTGLDLYGNAINVEFTLIPLVDADKSSLSLFPQSFVYDGTEHTAVVKGFDKVNMNITGNKATDAGTYTIEITPKTGKWSDGTTNSVIGKWQILKADPEYTVPTGLSGVKNKALRTVSLPESFSWMNGNTVMDTAGEQTFKAKYIPSVTKNYNIIENIDIKVNVAVPNISSISISGMSIKLSSSAFTYNGKSIAPSVAVTDSGRGLTKNTDYTVSYSNNKYVGTAKVTIKGIGAYAGTVIKTFNINPTKVSVSKVKKAGSGKMKVTWKKHSTQTTGFQIQYSMSSKFTGAKTVTVSGSKATTKTIKKLKKGKKYYIRVRSYKIVNKVKYYSNWSSRKSVRV